MQFGNFVEQAEEEDPKLKRLKMIKRQVLQKKVQAVRQGAGEDIVASHEPEGEMVEAKVDQGRSDYGKASIRNYRRSGPGHGEPAMFDSENKRGKTIDKRREEHKERRGVKGAKVPAYKVEGYQRNPERDTRSARQRRMDDPDRGINSQAFRDFMAAQQRPSKPKKKKEVKENIFSKLVEADKKGKGSGTKDACYNKVKASAKVWPSAYASGRLVQCRKKGAANYGKGSD